MTNLEKSYGINSIERRGMDEQQKVPYIDEYQFRLVHPPKPTETRKSLDQKFSERKEVEKDRLWLKHERHELVEQYNNLNDEIKQILEEPATTPEEQKSKLNRIAAIKAKQKEIVDQIKEKDKEIKKKDEELENLNKKIYELTEKIREEEHKENENDTKRLQQLNSQEAERLKELL